MKYEILREGLSSVLTWRETVRRELRAADNARCAIIIMEICFIIFKARDLKHKLFWDWWECKCYVSIFFALLVWKVHNTALPFYGRIHYQARRVSLEETLYVARNLEVKVRCSRRWHEAISWKTKVISALYFPLYKQINLIYNTIFAVVNNLRGRALNIQLNHSTYWKSIMKEIFNRKTPNYLYIFYVIVLKFFSW